MGFEKTVSEYQQAKEELAGSPPEEINFIRANGLQKAWADRMCEALAGDENARDGVATDVTLELGTWFRERVLDIPEHKKYFLSLFDEHPEQAVEELSQLYRSTLH